MPSKGLKRCLSRASFRDRKASFGYVQPFSAIVVFQSAAISLLCRSAMLEQIGCQTCVHLLHELGVVVLPRRPSGSSGLGGSVKFLNGEEKLRHASLKDFCEAD